jgi:hypothetical protein
MENTISKVKKKLLKEDKISVNTTLLNDVAKQLKERNIPVTVTNLYNVCMVGGVEYLKQYNKRFK